MGTRIFVLTIRVSLGGEPLFNRVVSFHHRTPEVPLNECHLIYRCVRLDWGSLLVTPGELGEERAVLGNHRAQVFAQIGPGDSDPELTSEAEEMA